MMTPGERHDVTGTDLVPATTRPNGSRSGLLWYVGVAASVAIMARYPMLGLPCLAMGLRTQVERFGLKGFGCSIGIACGVLAAWCLAFGLESMVYAATLTGVCIAVSGLMWKRRASVLSISLVVAACAAVSMGIDAVSLARAGYGLAEAMCAMLAEAARAYTGGGIEAELALTALEPVFESIWPIVYVTTALMNVGVAGLGSMLGGISPVRPGSRLSPADARGHIPQPSSFDAPLWAVGLLALAVLGIAVSTLSFPYVGIVRTASWTLLLSVRYIFTIQGLAVVLALLVRWRTGCFLRVVVIMIAISLETMFVLSIIGLVDVWANFRKLPRDGAHTEAKA